MATLRCRRFVSWACLEPATQSGYLTVSACITLPTKVKSVRAGLAELGLNPDDRAAVIDLAAVGATLVGWRTGPLEDWHSQLSSRISDPELVRASVATTRLVRDALISQAPPKLFDSLVGVLSDLERRLPDGRTLAEIAPSPDEARMHVAFVHAAVRRWEALAAVVGPGAVVGILACAGGWRARRWWGSPWWPRRVSAFLDGLDEQARCGFRSDHGIGPEALGARLLDGLDRMDSGLVAACLRAGIGDAELAAEPLVRRRFKLFSSLVEPDTPDEEHRRLLSELLGREGAP